MGVSLSPVCHYTHVITALTHISRIIGAGWISSMFVEDIALARPDVTDVAHAVAAVGSRDITKAQAFIDKHIPNGGTAQQAGLAPPPVACGSYQEVFDHPVSGAVGRKGPSSWGWEASVFLPCWNGGLSMRWPVNEPSRLCCTPWHRCRPITDALRMSISSTSARSTPRTTTTPRPPSPRASTVSTLWLLSTSGQVS